MEDNNDKSYAKYSPFDVSKKKKATLPPNRGLGLKPVAFLIILTISFMYLSGLFSNSPFSTDLRDNNHLTENTEKGSLGISAILYSSPTCGCCHLYTEIMNNEGFDVFQKRTNDYLDIKYQNGIPEENQSCHTMILDVYFIEGHIPKSVIIDLLMEKPDIDGISLADMPAGSPGMDGSKSEVWNIYSIKDGIAIGIFQSI